MLKEYTMTIKEYWETLIMWLTIKNVYLSAEKKCRKFWQRAVRGSKKIHTSRGWQWHQPLARS